MSSSSPQESCISMDDARKLRRSCVAMFTDHPRQVGESYCQHFAYAGVTGLKLVGLGLVSMVHGLCPCLFESTVSTAVPVISRELLQRKPTTAPVRANSPPVVLQDEPKCK